MIDVIRNKVQSAAEAIKPETRSGSGTDTQHSMSFNNSLDVCTLLNPVDLKEGSAERPAPVAGCGGG